MRDGSLLLIRYRPSPAARPFWLIPGGGREPGETEDACVRREILEETGLGVSVERLLFEDDDAPGGTYLRRRTYLCRVESGVPAPGHEPEEPVLDGCGIVAVGWFDLRTPEVWCHDVRADPATFPLLMTIREILGYG